MTDSATSWQTYEQVATYLLNRVADSLGLQFVEGKQAVVGLESGTSWEMDAKGICSDGVGFVLIEIKRYATRKINQRDLGAVAYQIRDVAASGGIVVTPLGLQEGAKKVAAAAQIVSVQLNENSTTTQYVLRFLNRVMLGLEPEAMTISARPLGGTLTTVKTKHEIE